MNLFEMYETNKTEEVDGKWFTEGPARVKLARMGGKNTKYFKMVETIGKKYNISSENISDKKNKDKAETMMLEVFVKAIVKDWQTLNEDDEWVDGIVVRDSKGKVSIEPYASKHAIKLLEVLPDFYNKLNAHASGMKSFLIAQEEEDLKN